MFHTHSLFFAVPSDSLDVFFFLRITQQTACKMREQRKQELAHDVKTLTTKKPSASCSSACPTGTHRVLHAV
jgi:hypothetical protein